MAYGQATLQQPTALSCSRSQVRSRRKADCLVENRVEPPEQQLTRWSRELQCHSRGKVESIARDSFLELGSQEGCRHSSCMDSSPGAEFHPRRCNPSDRAPPRLHTRADTNCHARLFGSRAVLWTPGTSGASEKAYRARRRARYPERTTSGDPSHGSICALRNRWHPKPPLW